MRLELVRKGESRCYVFKQEHIDIVDKIIKEMDEFEHGYMPEKWICFWDYPTEKFPNSMVYNGKFDIDVIKLKIACAAKGIAISVVSSNYPDDECY